MPDFEDQLRNELDAHASRIATPTDPPPGLGDQVRRRRVARFSGIAAASVVVVGSVVLATSLRTAGDEHDAAPGPPVLTTLHSPSTSTLTTESRSVPLAASAPMRCVENYTTATLANRAFAFDGTVVSIQNAPGSSDATAFYVEVTFDVNEWFVGGQQRQIAVQMLAPDIDPTIDRPEYRVGSRLLISGESRGGGAPLDDPIAWACGFSRTYDEATGADWRAVFQQSG